MPPSRLRKHAAGNASISEITTVTLQLAYRPPYDWNGVLEFLAARALKGIEHVTSTSYARTVRLGDAKGWIRVTQAPKGHAIAVELTHSLTPVLPALLARIRALFDLDARPDLIAKQLRRDARLAAAVKATPGRRVPGAFNGFELGVRAILGQQVTVRAATTVAGRFVEAFGDPIVTPFPELHHLTPARGARGRGQRRRHRPARHHRRSRQEHHRAGPRAGIRRAQPRPGRRAQSR